MKPDVSLYYLLELDGIKYVVNEHLGLWVKFEAYEITPSAARPHGVKYSLTLHDRTNQRIMGFDNAHIVGNSHDHWHRTVNDPGRPYHYQNAGKLIEDFWKEVEKILQLLEMAYEQA